LEYIFKHALTQEVVYNGLLKKERKEIHERIGQVMEELFRDRLSEFYETLAFHFRRGQSFHKAVGYLMKSGEKSLKRYAVEESHQYYEEAYHFLLEKQEITKKEEKLLIDLLIKWTYVFYYRGDFKGLTDVLTAHEGTAESLNDKARVGMFYVWMGLMLWEREKFRESYEYLHRALGLGNKIDNKRIIGYSSALLCFAYKELGLLVDEGIEYGKRGNEIAQSLEADHFLFFKSLFGMEEFYFARGEKRESREIAKKLLDYGQKHNNVRSLSVSHICMGNSHFLSGDFLSAIECYQMAIETSVDPFYSQIPVLMTALSHISMRQFKEAEAPAKEVLSYSHNFGCDILKTPAQLAFGTVLISKGHFKKGIDMLAYVRNSCLKNERIWLYAFSEYVLGNVYLHILHRTGPTGLSTMAKNIGFLTKNVPFAGRKGRAHFMEAIEVSEKIGAKSILGPAHLYLGSLHLAKKRKDQAKECISKAIQIFKQCEAVDYLKQAEDTLGSLG
jgi:tetratricopeptide (TPR) repeat protein